MPEALLDRLDTFADEHGYSGRSEVFREASRSLLEEFHKRESAGQLRICTMTVMFEYCRPDIRERLTRVRHEYDSIVSANSHAHVGDQYCLELFVLEGRMDEIAGVINTVRGVSDTRAVNYSVTPIGDLPDKMASSEL